MLLPSRTKNNPVFYPAELRRVLADQPERLERALSDPASVDVLTWNVFASLDTHSDRDWLAHRLAQLGLDGLTAPLRISLWSGRTSGPQLTPSSAYIAEIRRRTAAAGGAERLREFEAPIEIPVRIESGQVVVLLDVALDGYPRGAGGRDRLLELVDAGLEQARRVGKRLVVAAVTPADGNAHTQVARRIGQLSQPEALEAELGRTPPAPLAMRHLSWQQVLAVWRAELRFLRLGGARLRAFDAHCRAVLGDGPASVAS